MRTLLDSYMDVITLEEVTHSFNGDTFYFPTRFRATAMPDGKMYWAPVGNERMGSSVQAEAKERALAWAREEGIPFLGGIKAGGIVPDKIDWNA